MSVRRSGQQASLPPHANLNEVSELRAIRLQGAIQYTTRMEEGNRAAAAVSLWGARGASLG